MNKTENWYLRGSIVLITLILLSSLAIQNRQMTEIQKELKNNEKQIDSLKTEFNAYKQTHP